MATPFSRMWALGSVSPLQVIRGMMDMSLRWSHESLLAGAARILLLGLGLWGGVDLVTYPAKGVVLLAVAASGFYGLRRL